MSKISLVLLIIYVLNASANAQSSTQVDNTKNSTEDNEGSDELQEFEVDELIKTLEARINTKEASSEEHSTEKNEQDSSDTEEQPLYLVKSSEFEGPPLNAKVNPNPRDRKSINNQRNGRDEDLQAEISAILDNLESRPRTNRKKTRDNYDDVDELIKEAYGLTNERTLSSDSSVHRNQLGDYDKDDQYHRDLLRLLSFYRLYNKRYMDEDLQEDDRSNRRSSQSDLPFRKKLEFTDSEKVRPLDRSRFIADRIAESALLLGYNKGRIADREPPVKSKSFAEENSKRDVEVAASSSSASSSTVDASVSTGGLVGGGLATGEAVSTAGAVNVASSTSVATSGSVDTAVGVSGGLHVGGAASLTAGLGARTNLGLGLLGQLNSCEDFERKMIMDMAIEEASAMIRKLAYETRGEIGCKNDPDFERRILGLAIDLVNKVTIGVTGNIGNKFDLLGGYRYNTVDDYLKSSIYDADLGADVVSNAGFDYIRHRDLLEGRRLFDNLDLYDDYLSPYPRGRCDSCSKYDIRMGNLCPVCKRSGNIVPDRKKRKLFRHTDDKSKIYHLEPMQQVQNKRRNFGGVWKDANKLYNFNEFENDKFIDLSINCSESSESTKQDCQRLQLELVTPEDADPVPLYSVRDYLSQGRDLAVDMHERARSLQNDEGLRPIVHTPSMLQFMNSRASGTMLTLNEESQIMLFGTKVLQEKLWSQYSMKPGTFLDFLRHHGFRVTGNKTCRTRQDRCNSVAKFRSIDGSCNNLANPSWGQSNTAFVRILPARYADDIHQVPVSVLGGPLPNSRLVSVQLFSRRNATDSLFTLALMQWGQILAHDFARQVIDQTVGGGIECCDNTGSGPLPKTLQHHSCLPIVVPVNDTNYAKYGQGCMNFVRSMTVVKEDCSLGPADQLNGVSSFLDLSPVYGADRSSSDTLRENRGGRMRTEIRSDRIMMPTLSRSGYCDARNKSDVCFETGDVRTNQNPQLVVLQTLLIREHNRIAYELEALNSHWSDERLFQETRRIVIAEYQHITYRHWIPLVIGEKYCRESIFPAHDELLNDYDATVNPGTINGFTSGAFRFLHSMIEGSIILPDDSYSIPDTLRLSDFYFRPQIVEPRNNFEALLRGLVYQTIQKPDANFHEEVTEYLFRSGNDFGMDLEALDVQRGRDHGIPGYNAYREICHLGRAEDFEDLINEIPFRGIEKLKNVYRHVDDIDLLVGATLETRVPGSLLGPTLQCLIGEQFYRSRVGDKYFYNNANFPHSFTPEQFEEIKKASLASLICDSGDAVYEIQQNPFKAATRKNPQVSCCELPQMNLEHWKEEVHH